MVYEVYKIRYLKKNKIKMDKSSEIIILLYLKKAEESPIIAEENL